MWRLLAIGVLALSLSAVEADAGSAPVVPTRVQSAIKAKAPRLAYVPTRMLIGFRYRSWRYESGVLRIRFRNKSGWEVTFVAAPARGSCLAGVEKRFQLAGEKVYWAHTSNEQQAWRCVVGPGGRKIRLVAASPQPPTKLADVGLGRVASFARPIR